MTHWFSLRSSPWGGRQVAGGLLALMLSVGVANAHNGDDHGAAVPLVAPGSPRFFTATAASEKFELVLRYEPLAAHEPAKLRLFVADFATNAPITKARLTLTVVEAPTVRLVARETAPGDYLLTGEFPQNRPYGLTVQVVGPDGRADLLLLRPVAVGQSLPAAGADAAPTPAAAPLPWRWVLLTVGGFAAGAGLTAFFFLRNRRRSS